MNNLNHVYQLINLVQKLLVNKDFNQNGAIRVMRYPYNFQKNLSVHVGVVVTDITDIHSKKDLKGLPK